MTNELVFKAQSGDGDSTLLLLKEFGYRADGDWELFLGKYFNLLWYGKANLKDKDTRRFLQLYISNKDIREKLVYHYQDYVGQLAGQQAADYLQEKVSCVAKEDLKQALVELFLESVMKYKQTSNKIDFAGYLYNSYRYKVYHYLKKTVFRYDVLQHPSVESFTETVDPDSLIEPQEWWFDRFYASEIKRDDLGLFWINGRCSALFEPLSVFERMVLRDHYFYRLTDKEIASRYGYHINTIHNRRHRAVTHLKENIKESSLL